MQQVVLEWKLSKKKFTKPVAQPAVPQCMRGSETEKICGHTLSKLRGRGQRCVVIFESRYLHSGFKILRGESQPFLAQEIQLAGGIRIAK